MNYSRRDYLKVMSLFPLVFNARAVIARDQIATLKSRYFKEFFIGTAVGAKLLNNPNSKELAIIKRDFNSITPENCMKWGEIRSAEGGWIWADADKFVEFSIQNDLHAVGHALIWHSQIEDSVFKKSDGKYISKASLLRKMDDHITTLVSRYKRKLATWDVVNEAIGDDNKMRNSHWFNILGQNYIYRAFNLAHEVDPKCELIYNDYNIENPGKREAAVEMIVQLQKKGMPIHGVGIQAHLGLDGPNVQEIEKSIIAFSKLGLQVHFTELDIDVLPSVWTLPIAEISTRFEYTPERDPFREGLPKELEDKLARRYESLFKVFIKHADNVNRVTLWGVGDGDSWLNDFPIAGRKNYPLLFDRNLYPKKAYFNILNLK